MLWLVSWSRLHGSRSWATPVIPCQAPVLCLGPPDPMSTRRRECAVAIEPFIVQTVSRASTAVMLCLPAVDRPDPILNRLSCSAQPAASSRNARIQLRQPLSQFLSFPFTAFPASRFVLVHSFHFSPPDSQRLGRILLRSQHPTIRQISRASRWSSYATNLVCGPLPMLSNVD